MPPSNRRKQQCAAQHFGAWAIKGDFLRKSVAEFQAGRLPRVEWDDGEDVLVDTDEPRVGYRVDGSVAIIGVRDQLTKYRSSFGGTSYLDIRHAVRKANADSRVKSLMLVLDTPGGTVAGVFEAANEIANSPKPVTAFVDDLCCSGGYWLASQCSRIVASPTSVVGSIGVYLLLTDDTKMQEEIGIREVLVSSGGVKGLGADGKVTDELVGEAAREVLELHDQFRAAVQSGRGFSEEELTKVADGRVHVGENARSIGLIDEVSSLDAAMQALLQETDDMNREDFMKAAAEHNDWTAEAAKDLIAKASTDATANVQKQIDAARDEGAQAQLDRMKAINAAFPEDPKFAAEQIEKGASVDQAKLAHYDVLKGKVAEASRQQQASDPGAAGRPPVGFVGKPGGDDIDQNGQPNDERPVSEERKSQLLAMSGYSPRVNGTHH